MSLKLIHKGSTKDVYQSGEKFVFRFSDRYSVFDWGEMPDLLEGKGVALAKFTKAIYDRLQKKGIKHHLLNEDFRQDEIVVRPFQVVRDGSSIAGKENVFIPLEVIFRLGFAKGSSLSKRMKTPGDWKMAGMSRSYQELEIFESPMIEFTTKLERFDRPLTHQEAKKLSGLNETEWSQLLEVSLAVANELKEIFAALNITMWDGKIELAAGRYIDGNREIILVDSIGPDELRLTKNNVQLSKEIIRQYYRNTEWYSKLDSVKEKHKENFKEFITAPPLLPKEFKMSVEELYQILPELIVDNSAILKLEKLIMKLKGSL